MKKSVLAAAAVMSISQAASAAVVVNTWEYEGDVFVLYSGTLDTSGLTFTPLSFASSYITPQTDTILNLLASPVSFTSGAFSSITGSAGSSTTQFPSFSSGDDFAVSSASGGLLALPSGYTSGDSIFGEMTFAGETLATLGLNTGDVVYTLNSGDTVTWAIGTAPSSPPSVPLPAGLSLILGGLGALAWAGRQRRKA